MASNLWIVSAPNEGNTSSYRTMKDALDTRGGMCRAFEMPFPDFRVGTLDSLIAVSDAISRDDRSLESTVERVFRQVCELVPTTDLKTLLVDGVDVFEYVTDFEWDQAKFASQDSLTDLRKLIMAQVSRIEEDMKIRATDYSATKQGLAAIARKSQGNLMARSLETVITAADVVESEHLSTAFVVFPVYNETEFLAQYEELADLVVPRSARKISADNEYALFGVTVFKKSLEQFKQACRDRRFTVRDFRFEAGAADKTAEEEVHLQEQANEQLSSFTRWAETAFAETFIAMVHLKVLRVFVESVLRYGLPINFGITIMSPIGKQDARLRASLNEMFGHLGGPWAAGGDEEPTNVPGVVSDKNFYPYVYIELPLPKK